MDGMGKFLETYNLPKLNQEESENLNTQIAPSEIEAVIKNSQQTKTLKQMASQVNFYQTFWGELTPLLLKLFQKKNNEEGKAAMLIL